MRHRFLIHFGEEVNKSFKAIDSALAALTAAAKMLIHHNDTLDLKTYNRLEKTIWDQLDDDDEILKNIKTASEDMLNLCSPYLRPTTIVDPFKCFICKLLEQP